MHVLEGPQKGQSEPIEISETQSNRVVIGLSWDQRELSKTEIASQVLSGIKDIATGSISLVKANASRIMEKNDTEQRETDDINFDLDLICYIFDQDHNPVILVDTDAWRAIDESESVYHSGEDMTGFGGLDDEQIHVETKNIPDHYNNIFFVVQSDCKFSFDEIDKPEVRIADSKSNKNALRVAIEPPVHYNAYTFIFCQLFRKDEEWHVKNISDYGDIEGDIKETLQQYL